VISLSVCGPSIFEKIVTLSTSSVKKDAITINNFNNPKNINLHYSYLCPSLIHNHGFYFYVCEIKMKHLFQYKLLAIQANVKLSCITTERAALICAYKHINKKNNRFSQGQLAIDLSQSNYDIHNLFSCEDIEKKLIIKNKLHINIKKEYRQIATAIGLLVIGKKL